MPADISLPPNARTLRQHARHNQDSFVTETGDTRQYQYPLDTWLWTVLADMMHGCVRVFARVNSPLASLQEIPADVFKSLFWIESYREFEQNLWTEGTLLLADRETRLYSVHVVPLIDDSTMPPKSTVGARVASARKRGRPPRRYEEIEAAMRTLPREVLDAMKQAEMAARFGAAESTCRACRKRVLGQDHK